MDRLVIVAGVVAVASMCAAAMRLRRPDAPTQPTYAVPVQLDRNDFEQPEAPWLVVVFTSRTCASCGGTVERAQALAGAHVAVQEVEASAARDLHRRYAVDAVPMTVVADGDGVVRASFLGAPSATDLSSTVAELRDEDCEG